MDEWHAQKCIMCRAKRVHNKEPEYFLVRHLQHFEDGGRSIRNVLGEILASLLLLPCSQLPRDFGLELRQSFMWSCTGTETGIMCWLTCGAWMALQIMIIQSSRRAISSPEGSTPGWRA